MQCATAAIPARVCTTCTVRTQGRQQQRLARPLTASGARNTLQVARQQLATRRQAAARGSKRRCLAAAASTTYGSEWSTPKDAYLTVVRCRDDVCTSPGALQHDTTAMWAQDSAESLPPHVLPT